MDKIKSFWYNKTQKSQVVELQEMPEHVCVCVCARVCVCVAQLLISL